MRLGRVRDEASDRARDEASERWQLNSGAFVLLIFASTILHYNSRWTVLNWIQGDLSDSSSMYFSSKHPIPVWWAQNQLHFDFFSRQTVLFVFFTRKLNDINNDCARLSSFYDECVCVQNARCRLSVAVDPTFRMWSLHWELTLEAHIEERTASRAIYETSKHMTL